MGWDTTCVRQTKAEYVKQLLSEIRTDSVEVLGHHSNRTGLWCAIRSKTTGDEVVVLFLIEKQGAYWSCKSMDETSGPYYYDCPLKLLGMTKGTDHENSVNWRKRVRYYHAHVQWINDMWPKIGVGDRLLLSPRYRAGVYVVQEVLDSKAGLIVQHKPTGDIFKISKKSRFGIDNVKKASRG